MNFVNAMACLHTAPAVNLQKLNFKHIFWKKKQKKLIINLLIAATIQQFVLWFTRCLQAKWLLSLCVIAWTWIRIMWFLCKWLRARSETIVVLIVHACTAANSQSRLSMRELQTSICRSGYGVIAMHQWFMGRRIWTENHYEVSVKFFFFCCNVGLDASVWWRLHF